MRVATSPWGWHPAASNVIVLLIFSKLMIKLCWFYLIFTMSLRSKLDNMLKKWDENTKIAPRNFWISIIMKNVWRWTFFPLLKMQRRAQVRILMKNVPSPQRNRWKILELTQFQQLMSSFSLTLTAAATPSSWPNHLRSTSVCKWGPEWSARDLRCYFAEQGQNPLGRIWLFCDRKENSLA